MSKTERKVPTNKAVSDRKIEQELRDKVKELENEVKTLKTKLDELRKAKNTTLIKKEKEFVTTAIPHRGGVAATPKPSVSNASASANSTTHYQKEISELKSELEKLQLRSTEAVKAEDCGHEEIILALQNRLSDVESLNTALTVQNEQLNERMEQTYKEMSQKEAEHCNSMEKVKVELEQRWQAMYREWMRTTEAKITELQQANDIMRTMLERSRPE